MYRISYHTSMYHTASKPYCTWAVIYHNINCIIFWFITLINHKLIIDANASKKNAGQILNCSNHNFWNLNFDCQIQCNVSQTQEIQECSNQI